MKESIFGYFEGYEVTHGYAATREEEKRLFKMLLKGQKEEFAKYCEENNIDLDAYTVGNPTDDFDMWEEMMAQLPL